MIIEGLAHRGYPKKYPENTVTSFQAALDLSYSILELDVNMTKDGIPVVIHDPTLDRTTDGKGPVKDYTWEELQRFDAGSGQRIPLLEEILLLAKGRARVDIELKQSGDLYPGMEQAVVDVIRRCGMEEQVFVTSFDHYAIIRMRELAPELELGLVIYGATPAVFPLMEQLKAKYLSVKYIYLTDDYVRLCEEKGIQLIAWTIDDESAMRQLRERFPQVLICTNELERWAGQLVP
ncbi:glycerophosphoryl diester phosphodiesterase [Paenibacillus sp. UNCCL117]|uniref:glycerophosphodiester phosphodiesterase n=1 Tax=unclassified Paenibacillus TaxID=185978 RepID=UPI0008893333|nr:MULTISPECIES: glycerophosphodiester phosphodiesterase family protein [unclassified Paenibacillus]SDD82321.1 glycerophosphoryl diester phosphodiesterase [Paenibacillus sp. cl123]SFW55180.1 glycerophosphoryl diester phosphodiesterase [Paenibacillus sp. UNCCL117]